MAQYTALNVNLTDGQRARIRAAFKKRNGLVIQLSNNQIKNGGRDKIAVTTRQWNDIQKHIQNGTGCRINLSQKQLKENAKGGFLPLVFAGLGALGALLGGASAVANSVIDYKDRKKKLEEQIRHNKAIEQIQGGSGLRKRVLHGRGVLKKKFSPLTNTDIMYYALNKFKIPGFRGAFMRDELPKTPNIYECGIINLGDSNTMGSHWTAYYKDKNIKYYFDSYGDANPPKELVEYLGSKNLFYNSDRIQNYNDPPICGHLCLVVLYFLSQRIPFTTIVERLKSNKYFWSANIF